MLLALLFPGGALAVAIEISYGDWVEAHINVQTGLLEFRFQGAAGDRIRVQLGSLQLYQEYQWPWWGNPWEFPDKALDDYRCIEGDCDHTYDNAPPYVEYTGRLRQTGSHSIWMTCFPDPECVSHGDGHFWLYLTLLEPAGEKMGVRPEQPVGEGSPVRRLDWGARKATGPPRRLSEPPQGIQ